MLVGVFARETAGLCEKCGDDGIRDGEDEERVSSEFTEEVSGDGNGEREARERPGKKEKEDAEFENANGFGNGGEVCSNRVWFK